MASKIDNGEGSSRESKGMELELYWGFHHHYVEKKRVTVAPLKGKEVAREREEEEEHGGGHEKNGEKKGAKQRAPKVLSSAQIEIVKKGLMREDGGHYKVRMTATQYRQLRPDHPMADLLVEYTDEGMVDIMSKKTDKAGKPIPHTVEIFITKAEHVKFAKICEDAGLPTPPCWTNRYADKALQKLFEQKMDEYDKKLTGEIARNKNYDPNTFTVSTSFKTVHNRKEAKKGNRKQKELKEGGAKAKAVEKVMREEGLLALRDFVSAADSDNHLLMVTKKSIMICIPNPSWEGDAEDAAPPAKKRKAHQAEVVQDVQEDAAIDVGAENAGPPAKKRKGCQVDVVQGVQEDDAGPSQKPKQLLSMRSLKLPVNGDGTKAFRQLSGPDFDN